MTNDEKLIGQKETEKTFGSQIRDNHSGAKEIEIKQNVRKQYGYIATQGNCGCSSISKRPPHVISLEDQAKSLGYSEKELESIPKRANMGLGCGNPTGLGEIKGGDIVIDLGSGGGMDAFIAAEKTGPMGKVIGVDMTPDMIDLARKNALESGVSNVEFRLGEIENLPVADATADLIISNCVINLSTSKSQVFREAFRVLRPGGRIMISDVLLTKPISEKVQKSLNGWAMCVSGAQLKEEYLQAIRDAGFERVEIVSERPMQSAAPERQSKSKTKPTLIVADQEIEHELTYEELDDLRDSIVSADIRAMKPSNS